MRNLTLVSILVLGILFSFRANASSARLIELLLSSNLDSMDEMFLKHAIPGSSAKKIKYALGSSLDALKWKKGAQITEEELTKLLKSFAGSGESAAKINNLQRLLSMEADQLTQKELIEAINNIFYVAEVHGKYGSYLMHCSSCSDTVLQDLGVKFLVRMPKEGSTAYKLMYQIPSTTDKLNKYLVGKFKQYKLGSYSEMAIGKVLPEEKKTLAIFLGTVESGIAQEKKLVESIMAFNKKDDGTIDLLSTNKLWKIFEALSEPDLSPKERMEFMDSFAKVLDDIAKENPKGLNRNKNLQEYLEKMAQEKGLTEDYKAFRKMNCWNLF